MINELRETGKAFQLSLVEDDGELTWPEYDRLFNALHQCVAEAGGEIEARLLSGHSYQIAIGAPRGSDAHSCPADYWEPLGPHWSLAHQPSVQELLAANRALSDCLRVAGVDFDTEQPNAEDFAALGGLETWLSEPYSGCSEKVSIEYGMPTGFAGY
jgi:hypothetical protein